MFSIKCILFFLTYLLMTSCATIGGQKKSYNTLILDSSFAPIQIQNYNPLNEKCALINENNINVPPSGLCFDKEEWEALKAKDISVINSYLDAVGKKKNILSKNWSKIKNTVEAKKTKSMLKLQTHGSRSLYLIQKFSNNKAHPLLVRNMTATVDGVTSEKKCSLNQWSYDEKKAFNHMGLQDHQKRVSDLLTKHPTIRVVNISLGYKKSWIAEDNPHCSQKRVDAEYEVLKKTWRNLVKKHKNVFFVVAAGNEGENFSNHKAKNNDLWGAISDEKNLILVGSLDPNNKRSKFSNYGLGQMYWALGQDIGIMYPHPKKKRGYSSMAHGTSSSAAIVSGKIIKALIDGVEFNQVKAEVSPFLVK